MGVTGKVLWTLSEGSMATQFRLTIEEAAKVRRICTAVNMYAQMLHECDIDQSGEQGGWLGACSISVCNCCTALLLLI